MIRRLLPEWSQLPAGHVILSRFGTRFELVADPMFRNLFLFGDYEPSNSEIFRTLVRPGDTVVDIGANFGWYAALLAREVGENGSVFAIEPLEGFYNQMLRNLELNQIENVSCHQIALGEEAGELRIYTFSDLPQGYASSFDRNRKDAKPNDCPVVPLDDFVTEHGINTIDFLKIDVEGHEPMVFKGGRNTLSQEMAPLIAFEVNTSCLQSNSSSGAGLQEQLRTLGYTKFFWSHNSRLHPVLGAIPDRNSDYIAAKPSRLNQLSGVIQW